MSEHVILIAFEVEADSRKEAYEALLAEVLPLYPPTVTTPSVVGWWMAEDERYDESDCMSAVFVPVGTQQEWRDQINPWKD